MILLSSNMLSRPNVGNTSASAVRNSSSVSSHRIDPLIFRAKPSATRLISCSTRVNLVKLVTLCEDIDSVAAAAAAAAAVTLNLLRPSTDLTSADVFALPHVLVTRQVDVIVSEWMGYFLLRESMLDSVVVARYFYNACDIVGPRAEFRNMKISCADRFLARVWCSMLHLFCRGSYVTARAITTAFHEHETGQGVIGLDLARLLPTQRSEAVGSPEEPTIS